MSSWERVYRDGVFAITTDEPSRVVKANIHKIPKASNVADIGCGAGRNARYLARHGHRVQAYDLVDLDWLTESDHDRITFERVRAEELQLQPGAYGAVLLMRLIQYLPSKEVASLLQRSTDALMPGGLLLLNYTNFGGSHDDNSFDVDKYKHPVDDIASIVIGAGLDIDFIQEQDVPPQHVTLDYESVHACDLVAIKSVNVQ